MTLSPDQARSVIAHELGHLSGSHSAFASRIYRSRIAWGRVMNAFDANDSLGGQFMHRFFSWYAPRFSAYSFALARQNEYEADNIAAELTSATDAGSALVAVHTLHNRLDNDYWHALYKTADHLKEPHKEPWRKLNDHIAVERKRDFEEELTLALSYASDYSDTHPSLKQRLENLNVEPELQSAIEVHAAENWLGEKLPDVIADFDQNWVKDNLDGWKARYGYVKESKSQISEFESRATADLSEEEMWKKFLLWSEFKADEEITEVINEGVSLFPENTHFRFVRGRDLAFAKDIAALADLEIATGDPSVNVDACLIAEDLLLALDRQEEASQWRHRAEEFSEEHHARYLEEHQLSTDSKMRKSGLTSEERDNLTKVLKNTKLVKKAWIAEKEVSEGVPTSLAIVVTNKKLFFLTEEKFLADVRQSIPDFNGWLFLKNGEEKHFAKKVLKIKDRLF